MMNIDMKLPMLVTPTPLLSHFMSLATMEGLISKFMFRTSLSNVFIGLNRYYRLVFRFRSMAAFPMLGVPVTGEFGHDTVGNVFD